MTTNAELRTMGVTDPLAMETTYNVNGILAAARDGRIRYTTCVANDFQIGRPTFFADFEHNIRMRFPEIEVYGEYSVDWTYRKYTFSWN